MNLGIAAREQFAGFVGDIDLGEERAGNQINRFGGANDFALKFAARELRQIKNSGKTGMNGRGSALWNVNIHANGIGLREGEEQLCGTAISGVHQSTDIHVAASRSEEHTSELQ